MRLSSGLARPVSLRTGSRPEAAAMPLDLRREKEGRHRVLDVEPPGTVCAVLDE